MENKKTILVISNYFPPEKGAASNRMFSMVDGFSKQNYKVTVVCPLPNYPQGKIFEGFKGKLYQKETTNFGEIYRLWLWPSNSSNKFVRLFSMISFSISLKLFFFLKRIPKKVVIQYSPVFVGFTAVFLSILFRKKIILNVSDLWPLAGLEMGLLKKGAYYSILEKMEHFCYRKSDLILGQSEEILQHIKNLKIEQPLFLYRNFPDFIPPKITKKNDDKNVIKIVYAGLLGVAQGLLKICSEVEFTKEVQLHIYGNGPETEKIKNINKENIFYHGELDREILHKELQKYDIGFVPLTNRIYGSVPSKIFELSRLGLPVLYFAGGEGETIVNYFCIGWTIPVNNNSALQDFITTLSSEKLKEFSNCNIQEKSVINFDLNKQFEKLVNTFDKI
ncbi:MAG: glycosyltransferase family 4 protein [Flavobacteriaceae bacterium]|nr:glycosyltransferase family 4 protein [Flavobacteriaceae bacterium]